MIIEQDRNFTLRTWREEDAPSLAAHANNMRIWNQVRDLFPHPYTVADAEAFIASVRAKGGLWDFAVEVGGAAVGGVGFTPQSDVERFNAEIGYWLGAPYWGRGIMTAAVRAACAYLFAHTELHRFYAMVYQNNPASMRVLEKSGFRNVGRMRDAYYKNGVFIDGSYYERVKSE